MLPIQLACIFFEWIFFFRIRFSFCRIFAVAVIVFFCCWCVCFFLRSVNKSLVWFVDALDFAYTIRSSFIPFLRLCAKKEEEWKKYKSKCQNGRLSDESKLKHPASISLSLSLSLLCVFGSDRNTQIEN